VIFNHRKCRATSTLAAYRESLYGVFIPDLEVSRYITKTNQVGDAIPDLTDFSKYV
jgi:hypothetical protein